MSILDLLKPSRPVKEIQDADEVKKKYKYWRWRTFYAMYLGYFFYYFTRKSFTFVLPSLMADLHLEKVDVGILGTILSLSYGISRFLSGIISDKSNPRYFMAFGLILTGVFNILFGLSSSFMFLALFWGLNGYFQGWGEPPCAKLLTHWYSQSERGSWWSVWNTSHTLGGAATKHLIGPLIIIVGYFGWRWSLHFSGIISILAGLFVINRLRDTPQSLGLPPIERFRNESASLQKEEKEEKEKFTLSAKEILLNYVLNNKYIWILALSYFFIYIILTAINDWSLLFLVESKGYSTARAWVSIFFFGVGGFFGSLAAGFGSDYLFKGKRGPVNAIFALLVLGIVIAMWKLPFGYPLMDSVLIFLAGFFIFGPQMLIGVAVAELSHKRAAGTATGFAGVFAYLGAATAGFPLGWVLQKWGWEGFFGVLALCGIISFLCLVLLWKVNSNSAKV